MRPRPVAPAIVGAALVLLAGCASPGDSGPIDPGSAPPAGIPAAQGPVAGQGTVLQLGDAAPQLCLGAVAESYPPQCSGPEIVGWDWEPIELKETANDVTWGTFAVVGRWDGATFELTEPPVPLALHDPMPTEPDPRLDPESPGAGSDDELLELQQSLHADSPVELLMSWPENGYLFVTVVYDDGSIQEHFDESHGEDLVAVRSALRDI